MEQTQRLAELLKRRASTANPKTAPSSSRGTKRRWNDHKGREEEMIKGRFSQAEEQAMKESIQKFFDEAGMKWDEGARFLLTSRKAEGLQKKTKHLAGTSPWLEIGECLPNRRMDVVATVGIRILNQYEKSGSWKPEEVVELCKLVELHGEANWQTIGNELRRHPGRCCDYWNTLKVRVQTNQALRSSISGLMNRRKSETDSPAPTTDAGPTSEGLEFDINRIPNSQNISHFFETKVLPKSETEDVPASSCKRKRSSRFQFTPENDAEILRLVRKFTKLKIPQKNIPWMAVAESMTSRVATRNGIRSRYTEVLLPQLLENNGELKNAPSENCEDEKLGDSLAKRPRLEQPFKFEIRRNVLTRQIVRHIRFVAKAHGDLSNLDETNWTGCVVMFPNVEFNRFAKDLFDRRVPEELASKPLRKKIKFLYKNLKCKKHEEADMSKLLELCNFLKDHNGEGEVTMEGLVLPREFSKDLARMYSRRQSQRIKQKQTAMKGQAFDGEARIQSSQQDGMDYLDYHLLNSVGLLDSKPEHVAVPVPD